MALVNCIECGREISDKASACPHCGCPVEAAKAPIDPGYPEFVNCRDCKKEYPFAAAFCPACGLMNYQKDKLVTAYEAKVAKAARAIDPESPVICPNCKSQNSLATGSKGFGLGKALVGGALLGPIGLIGGFVGSGKTVVTCIKCGFKWSP